MNLEEWITNSNECFEINLTRPLKQADEPERVFAESFSPAFTYEIFKEAESIIGYKEPRIELDFRANDLRPSLKIQFEAKIELKGVLPDEQLTDLETALNNYFPPSIINAAEASDDAVSMPDATSKSWKPPGNLVKSFTVLGKQYEIWSANMADPVVKRMFEYIQILPILFIEGASIPELGEQWSQERWTLFLLYEVTPIEEDCSPYTLAGFSTVYRYWIFPTLEVMRATKSLPSPPASTNGDATSYTPPRLTQDPETFLFNETVNPLELPSRERISQFVILPPYQGQSLGEKLYQTIFHDAAQKPFVYEIPVEDPSETFDAMRDYADIVYLRSLPTFRSLSLPSTLPPEQLAKDAPIPRNQILGNGVDLDDLRHETKIVPRQFNRMVELHLLSTLPPLHRNKARITRKARSSNENDRKYYFWRLALKDRIYRQNADQLEQIEDASERVEMIEGAVDSQQHEYEERLEGIERRAKWRAGEVLNGEGSKAKRKRVVVEDEDDWEDIDEGSVASSKKMKV